LIRSEGRPKRFLKRLGNKRALKIVILVQDVTPELVLKLETEVGPDDWNPNRVIFRSGTPLGIEHLRRVDFANAAAIILSGSDFAYGGADALDTCLVKTLLYIANHGKSEPGDPLQLLTTEVFDRRKVSVAEATYFGPLEVLASNAFVAQLMAQNLRHPGLSQFFAELFSHNEDSEVYVRESNQFAGRPIGELRRHFGMPAVHVLAAFVLLVVPTLTVAAGAFLLFKAIDYSIFRASKEMLYIPMNYDARFRAKELIDSFGYRAGKGVASGGMVAAGVLVASLSGVVFPICTLAACGGWFVAANQLTGKTSGSA
jgi:hypothetical protein